MMESSWHLSTASDIAAIVRTHLHLHGSAAVPAQLSAASDVDVVIEVDDQAGWSDPHRWLGLGAIWAWERHLSEHQALLRLVLSDGRRADVSLLPRRGTCHPGPRIDPRGEAPRGVQPLPDLTQVANESRFAAAHAAARLSRNDLLVGAHLVLGIARAVLVRAMELRDREAGTTIHRFGGPLNQVAAQVMDRLPAVSSPQEWTDAAAELLALHEELMVRLDDRHVADLGGLTALRRRLAQ